MGEALELGRAQTLKAVRRPRADSRPARRRLFRSKQRGLLKHRSSHRNRVRRMPTFQRGANGRDHNPHGFNRVARRRR